MEKHNYLLSHLLKKMKKHEREVLLPLYKKHSEYLLRMIKTGNANTEILKRIETFVSVATCHEVAINQYSDLSIETHQNELGLEYEYSTHPKAKNISRDLRVRIIWRLIEKELVSNPNLDGFKKYDLILRKLVFCPQCGETIGEIDSEGFYYDTENNCHCTTYNTMTDVFSYESYNSLDLDIERFLELHAKFATNDVFADIAFIDERGEEILQFLESRKERYDINFTEDELDYF